MINIKNIKRLFIALCITTFLCGQDGIYFIKEESTSNYFKKPFVFDHLPSELKERGLSELDSYLKNMIEMINLYESGKKPTAPIAFKDSNLCICAALTGKASLERYQEYWKNNSYPQNTGFISLLIKFHEGDEALKIDTPITNVHVKKFLYSDIRSADLSEQQKSNLDILKDELIKLQNENDRMLSHSSQFDQYYQEKLQKHNSLQHELDTQKSHLKHLEDSSYQVLLNDFYSYITIYKVSFDEFCQDFKNDFNAIYYGNDGNKQNLVSAQKKEIRKLEDELNSLASELKLLEQKLPAISLPKPTIDLKINYEIIKPIFKDFIQSGHKTISDSSVAKYLTAFQYSIGNVYDLNQYFKETKAIKDSYWGDNYGRPKKHYEWRATKPSSDSRNIFSHSGHAVIYDLHPDSIKTFLNSIGSKTTLSSPDEIGDDSDFKIEHLSYTNQKGDVIYIQIKAFASRYRFDSNPTILIDIASKPFLVYSSTGDPAFGSYSDYQYFVYVECKKTLSIPEWIK